MQNIVWTTEAYSFHPAKVLLKGFAILSKILSMYGGLFFPYLKNHRFQIHLKFISKIFNVQ